MYNVYIYICTYIYIYMYIYIYIYIWGSPPWNPMRKGIPKYHAKFMPVATCVMNYEPIVTVNQDVANAPAPDGLSLDEKIEFVQATKMAGQGRWLVSGMILMNVYINIYYEYIYIYIIYVLGMIIIHEPGTPMTHSKGVRVSIVYGHIMSRPECCHHYPLVNNIAIENGHRNSEFSH